jgi:ABC-type polysaccharide/polyol phosphate transport system ATPase subunit
MSDQAGAIAIEVKNLAKEFHIAGNKGSNGSNSFFALRDVSFTLYNGDVMGIIGSNGSGKTTLLKILSQVIKPTSGEAHFYGTVTSILDIGSNFHPDLSGRENVHMQLKLSGIATRQFGTYYDQIKSFSEIGDFFDQPVKLYSSGMFLRLAFSIAFHLSSSILIIDEVLSVGDEGFRLKCQELLKMFKEQGRTILLVSHNKAEILELCNKCIWLDKGAIKKIGYPAEVLGEYFVMHRDNYDGKKLVIGIEKGSEENIRNGIIDLDWSEKEAPGNEILSIRHIGVSSTGKEERIYYENDVLLRFIVQKKREGIKIGAFFFLQDVFYQPVLVGHFLNNLSGEDYSKQLKAETGLIEIKCIIPATFLAPGKYYLMIRFGMEENEWNEESEEAFRFSEKLSFTIHKKPGYIDFIGDITKGSVRPPLDWEIKKSNEKPV